MKSERISPFWVNGYQPFSALIKPKPDSRTERNTHDHGLTYEMVADAPTCSELFPLLKSFIEDLPIVCHNSSTDIDIFRSCMEYYGLTGIDLSHYIATLEQYGKGLKAC